MRQDDSEDREETRTTEEEFTAMNLPPANSMVCSCCSLSFTCSNSPLQVTSTPVSLPEPRCTKLRRRVPPAPPGRTATPTPQRDIPRNPRLIRRAGPPTAFYPISINTTPSCPSPDVDENIFQTPSTRNLAILGEKRTLDTDTESDEEDENIPPHRKKGKRPTASGLDFYRRRIVDHAKPHIRARIAGKNPCPGGTEIDKWLTDAWLGGFQDVQEDLQLDKDTLPTDDELGLVGFMIVSYLIKYADAVLRLKLKQIFPQHRGAIKTEARGFVKQYYGFEQGAGEFTTDDTKNKNREIFEALTTKMSFAYKVFDFSC